jgi:hypothetical protein
MRFEWGSNVLVRRLNTYHAWHMLAFERNAWARHLYHEDAADSRRR